MLFARRETTASDDIVEVVETLSPIETDYMSRSADHVAPTHKFINSGICEVARRDDLNTLIGVHTHPDILDGAAFSDDDGEHEESLFRYIHKNFKGVSYGSIVFAQTDEAARMWSIDERGVPKWTEASVVIKKR